MAPPPPPAPAPGALAPGTSLTPGASGAALAPFRTPNFLTNRFVGGGGPMRFGPGAPLSAVGTSFPAGGGGQPGGPGAERPEDMLQRIMVALGRR